VVVVLAGGWVVEEEGVGSCRSYPTFHKTLFSRLLISLTLY